MENEMYGGTERLLGLFKQQKEELERAKRFRGQKPTAAMKRSRQQLAQLFSYWVLQEMMQSQSGNMTRTTFISEAYPPSYVPLSRLKPIQLRDLRLETHHRGRVLIVKTFCEPMKLTAIHTAVEDENGDVELLAIYNLPRNTPANSVLPNSVFVAVKEPYYKASRDGGVIVRVDHPADMIILASDDPMVPRKLRKLVAPPEALKNSHNHLTALQLKIDGNAVFMESNWQAAVDHYTKALKVAESDPAQKVSGSGSDGPELRRIILRNRATALLRLRRYSLALDDALSAINRGGGGDEPDDKDPTPNLKAHSLAGHAYYSLADFARAAEQFEQALALNPGDKQIQTELGRAQERMREQEEGRFDLVSISKSATESHRRLDHGSFLRNTVVKTAGNGMGRGLFAARDLKRGELIMVEKAFCVVFEDENKNEDDWMLLNINTNRARAGSQALLLFELIEKMTYSSTLAGQYLDLHSNNPSQATNVSGLDSYADEEKDSNSSKIRNIDGRVVLDMFQIQAIAELNSFGCARIKSSLREESVPSEQEGEKVSASVGVWLRASYANHSCIPNGSRSFIGDLMVVHASRPIKAGEQIFLGYKSPMVPYAERQRDFQAFWGFECACALCKAEARVPPSVMAERARLASEADTFMQANRRATPHTFVAVTKVQQAKKLLKRLRATYADDIYGGRAPLPRVVCVDLGVWLWQGGDGDLDAALAVVRDCGYKVTLRGDTAEIDTTMGIATHVSILHTLYAAEACAVSGQNGAATALSKFAREAFVTEYGSEEGFDARFRFITRF